MSPFFVGNGHSVDQHMVARDTVCMHLAGFHYDQHRYLSVRLISLQNQALPEIP